MFMAASVAIIASCDDDTTPVLELENAASLNAITPSEYVISKDNYAEQFPEISWEKASYGKGAIVNYELTLTNNATQKSVVIGETTNDTKLNLTNEQMNAFMAQTGAMPGKAGEYTVSMKSSTYKTYTNDASNTIKFTVTPYDPKTEGVTWAYAYVAENYPNWNFMKAYLIGDPDGDGKYEGFAQFDEDNATYAVLDGANPARVIAKDQKVETKGFVRIGVGADGSVEQSGSITWCLIGDATSGGWDKDTPMEYDATTRKWTCVTTLIDKELKFRNADDWKINLGSDGTENGLVAEGSNIKIAKAHGYIVTLDVTNAGKYTYSLEETDIEQSAASITMPGSFNNWNKDTEEYVLKSEARDFKFSGTYYIPSGAEFKLYDGSWLGVVGDMNWDENHTYASFVIGDGANMTVPVGGYFKIFVDSKKNTATMTKTGWEIIGSATAGGWDAGQVMDWDPDTKTWSIIATLTDGELKFRWDGSWDRNFGGALDALVEGGDNIAVKAGTYKIVLDEENKKATMTKE